MIFKKKIPKNSNSPAKESSSDNSYFPLLFIISLCTIIFGLYQSFYQIEPAQQGVITRLGAFSHVVGEGPHMKLPFGIDQVYKVEVTRIHELQFGFRKAGEISPEQVRLESLMLTGDLSVAFVEWILQYKIIHPEKYLFSASDVERNIRDVTISMMRRVVGDKLVTNVLTSDRIEIADSAKYLIQQTLDKYDMGVQVTTVALQNVTPPDSVKPAFNEVNIAKQEREQLINQARGTYNKEIPEAEGKAEKTRAEAKAYAIDIVNRAKGDSEKFKKIYASYKNSSSQSRKRIYLETMGEILTQVNSFTVIDEKLKGILPVFDQQIKIDKNQLVPIAAKESIDEKSGLDSKDEKKKE